ncbi:MAG: Gfo/Idh/MocA family oxidoreductase, partial [Rhodoglobus sp.]
FEHWAPEATASWKDQLPASAGGGVVFDLGSHLVDQALLLFGPASKIESRLRTVRSGGGNDDHAEIFLAHDSGVHSRLFMSRMSLAPGPRFRVLGTKGSYISHGLDPQELSLAGGGLPTDEDFGQRLPEEFGTLVVDSAEGPIESRVPMLRGNYGLFYREVAVAVRGEAEGPVSLSQAIDVVAVLEQATAAPTGDIPINPITQPQGREK